MGRLDLEDELDRLNRRVNELLETTNRYLEEKRALKAEVTKLRLQLEPPKPANDPLPPYQDLEDDLHHFGWAPGHYMSVCRRCGSNHFECDKRAYRCQPCATKLRDEWNALSQEERHARKEAARRGGRGA